MYQTCISQILHIIILKQCVERYRWFWQCNLFDLQNFLTVVSSLKQARKVLCAVFWFLMQGDWSDQVNNFLQQRILSQQDLQNIVDNNKFLRINYIAIFIQPY